MLAVTGVRRVVAFRRHLTEPKSAEIRSEHVCYLGFYRSVSAGWMCVRVAVWEYLPVFPDIT